MWRPDEPLCIRSAEAGADAQARARSRSRLLAAGSGSAEKSAMRLREGYTMSLATRKPGHLRRLSHRVQRYHLLIGPCWLLS